MNFNQPPSLPPGFERLLEVAGWAKGIGFFLLLVGLITLALRIKRDMDRGAGFEMDAVAGWAIAALLVGASGLLVGFFM